MIFSIGHSNHSLEGFIKLLRLHQIQILVDVRSAPYCKYATWFNKNELAQAIEENGMEYLYLGKGLGGYPSNPEYITPTGKIDYKKYALSEEYQTALQFLIEESAGKKTAIMCAEANPRQCHRHLLITKSLLEKEIAVVHILSDGSLNYPQLDEFNQEVEQLSLFG
ncbi:MAG: DUF488 domain-containing protein [bacterium]|nr:DUF488 domain-containing protein [bacterium]